MTAANPNANNLRCPCCRASLTLELNVSDARDELGARLMVRPRLQLADEPRNLVLAAILEDIRYAIRGGQGDLGSPADRKEFVDLAARTFVIQIFDSPEGDTWLRGRFRLAGPDLEIEESRHVQS